MHHRSHYRRHDQYSERNHIVVISGFVLVLVLALLGVLLWWTNRTGPGAP